MTRPSSPGTCTQISDRHEALLSSLPGLGDTQVSWLLLLYTAAPPPHSLPCALPHLAGHGALRTHTMLALLTALSASLLAEGPSLALHAPAVLTRRRSIPWRKLF